MAKYAYANTSLDRLIFEDLTSSSEIPQYIEFAVKITTISGSVPSSPQSNTEGRVLKSHSARKLASIENLDAKTLERKKTGTTLIPHFD
mmetsp:Transcript_33462/g.32513  ORF Transcript_33462/g.32513 Transcript_33462/m.32513 type:complete len:89 (-) Transcript_33462:952-1218(-)